MLIRRALARPSDRAFWAAWFAALAALAGLGVWSTRRYALPFDPAPTRWVQDLDRFALAGRIFGRVNEFGSYSFIGGMLIGFAVLLAVRGFRVEALVMAGAGAAHLVQLGVRQLVERPFSAQHPPWFAHADWGLRQFPGPNGFPSGHVFGEAIVYGLIILYAGRLIPIKPLAWAVRSACALEILLGGPARMYTGAHWPSDVLGAMLLAGLYLAIAWRIDGAVTRIRGVTAERRLAERAGLSGTAARPRRIVRPAAGQAVTEREPARTR
ncbi:MAG TPA: phosphatase PAP2 family protein [Dehalococcoidia bacterium]|nr:phosphatase PAP2 family protein [Dehalococcoidia bacterium]